MEENIITTETLMNYHNTINNLINDGVKTDKDVSLIEENFYGLKDDHFRNTSLLRKYVGNPESNSSYIIHIHTLPTAPGLNKLHNILNDIEEILPEEENNLFISIDNAEETGVGHIIIQTLEIKTEDKLRLKEQLSEIYQILEKHDIKNLYQPDDNFIDFTKNLNTDIAISPINGFVNYVSKKEANKILNTSAMDYQLLKKNEANIDHLLVQQITEVYDIENIEHNLIQQKIKELASLEENNKNLTLNFTTKNDEVIEYEISSTDLKKNEIQFIFRETNEIGVEDKKLIVPKVPEVIESFQKISNGNNMNIKYQSQEQIDSYQELHKVKNIPSANILNQIDKALKTEIEESKKESLSTSKGQNHGL